MIHIESKLIVIRGGDSFKEYGDPYDRCLSLFIFNDVAYVYGMTGDKGKFSRKDYLEIERALLVFGVEEAQWERKKGDKTINVTRKLNKTTRTQR